MLRRTLWRLTSDAQQYRQLSPGSLLTVIRNEPGESAKYYALRYFGPTNEPRVKHILWSDLKKFGHVTMERTTEEEPPRWYPNRYEAPQAPVVKPYRPEDWDLSVLKQMDATLSASGAADVVENMKFEERVTPPRPSPGGQERLAWMPPQKLNAPPAPPPAPPRIVPRKPRGWERDLSALATAAMDAEEVLGTAPSVPPSPRQLEASEAASAAPAPDAGTAVAIAAQITVMDLVTKHPRKGIQFYINLIHDPAQRAIAPAIFKDLRTAGLLLRAEPDASLAESQGATFVWSVV